MSNRSFDKWFLRSWVSSQSSSGMFSIEGSASHLGHSGVTEDRETFMSVSGLRSSFLARSTRALQVCGRVLMSGTQGCALWRFSMICSLACMQKETCNCDVRLTFKEIVSLSKDCFILRVTWQYNGCFVDHVHKNYEEIVKATGKDLQELTLKFKDWLSVQVRNAKTCVDVKCRLKSELNACKIKNNTHVWRQSSFKIRLAKNWSIFILQHTTQASDYFLILFGLFSNYFVRPWGKVRPKIAPIWAHVQRISRQNAISAKKVISHSLRQS